MIAADHIAGEVERLLVGGSVISIQKATRLRMNSAQLHA
jgi:hypothetical protein